MLVVDFPTYSSQPMYDLCYINDIKRNAGYTNEHTDEFETLKEPELNLMSLACAEKSLSADWDLENEKENAYWDSF